MHKIGVGCAQVTELEKKYVMEVLDNQRLSQGKYVAEFEKKFSKMHGQKRNSPAPTTASPPPG